jgi:citrate synthase
MGTMAAILAYAAAALVALWGVAHAIPTRQVLAGFEPITPDNRRVILQE